MTKKVGRKQFDGKSESEILTKLKYCWALGVNDAIASKFAGITHMSLCRYLKANPHISLEKEELLTNPILKAHKSVIEGFKDNPELALKYLKAKMPKEFSPDSQPIVQIENKHLHLTQIIQDAKEGKLGKIENVKDAELDMTDVPEQLINESNTDNQPDNE